MSNLTKWLPVKHRRRQLAARKRARLANPQFERLEDRRLLAASNLSGDVTNNVTWSQDTVIDGALTIRPGATVTVASGVLVTIQEGGDIFVEGGLNLNANTTVRFVDGSTSIGGSDNRIQVLSGGSIHATDSLFDRIGTGNDRTTIIVDSGGEFSFNDSSFDLDDLSFADGSIIGAAGVTGNGFDASIVTPVDHLFPGNPNLINNDRFMDVEILAGQSIDNGETLVLMPMGTVTTSNMQYRINGLMVAAGGRLDFGMNTETLIEENAIVSVGGTLVVDEAAVFRMIDGDDFNGSTNLVEVLDGGLIDFSDTTFDRLFSGDERDQTQLVIRSGGQFQSSNTTFDLDFISFEDASQIGAGGVTGNRFDTPIFTPVDHLFPGNPNLINNERFMDVEILAGQSIDNGETLVLMPMGTVTTSSMQYRINSLAVAAGGRLDFGVNTETLIEENAIVSVGGTLVVDEAAVFRMIDGDDFNGNINRLEVLDGGLIDFSDTTFDRLFSGDERDQTQLVIRSGGQFQSSNTTFDLDFISFEDASQIGAGGVTGNRFDTPIFTPVDHLFPGNPNLINNERFMDVEILDGQSIDNGETLVLMPMGTVTTSNMQYRINSLMVAAGGRLDFAINTETVIEENAIVSVGGMLVVDEAAVFRMIDGDDFNGSTNLVEVLDGGLIDFSDTTFDRLFSGDERDQTQLVIRSGGQFQSSNTTFDLDFISFEDASQIGAGGVTGNRFDTPIFTPVDHLFPGNPNLINNDRFMDVEILDGQSIDNGETLVLMPMGTVTTSNMQYRINSLMLAAGGRLDFAINTETVIEENAIVSVGGMLVVDEAAVFRMIDGDDFNGSTNLVEVLDGGLIDFSDTTFDRLFSGDERDQTQLVIRSGGQFQSSNTTFDLDFISFEDASQIGAGGVTGNRFDTPIFTPVDHLFPGNPNLINNDRFMDVEILAGQSIDNGETLVLMPMGTVTTSNMQYRINSLAVAAGGRLDFGVDSNTLILENATLSISGTTVVNNTGSFSMIDGDDFNGTQNLIEVSDGGTLRIFNSDITRVFSGDQRDVTQLVVHDGGRFTMTDSLFDLERLQLLGDEATVLRNDIDSEVQIDGGTLLDIELNDFGDLASGNSGLIAVGDGGATLDFRRNYWGTTIPSEIEDKILHKPDDAARPTIVYEPFLLQPNPIPDYAPVEFSINTSPVIAGGVVDVTYNVRNLSLAGDGDIHTAAAFFLAVGGATPDIRLLDFATIEPLLAGTETGPTQFLLNLPDDNDPIWNLGLPGQYSIRILVDATDSLPEFDETNNSLVSDVTVSPTVAIVEQSDGLTEVSEDGASDLFSVRLVANPQSDVIVRMTPDAQLDVGGGFGTPVELTFTPSTATTPVDVTVIAVDDSIVEGPQTRTVEFQLISNDLVFDGAVLPPLPVTISDNDSVQVLDVTINNGQSQRSAIDQIEVLFNTIVQVDSGAVQLQNTSSGDFINATFGATQIVDGKTLAEVRFAPTDLLDGNYQIVVQSSGVAAFGIPLDGDSDGSPGADYVDQFFRFFGDSDGDRDVDGQDYARFGMTFLKQVGDIGFDPRFDFDFDGDVDGQDFGRFGANFLDLLPE